MADAEIQAYLLTGEWLEVMRDVMICAGAPVTERMKAWTAVLAVGQPVALAGCWAGRALGLEQVPLLPRPTLIVPNNRDPLGLDALDIRRVTPKQWSVTWRHGLPVTPASMTIRDMAARLPYEVVRDVVQHALRRRRTSFDQLSRTLHRGVAGSACLRSVLEEVGPGFQAKWERLVHRAVFRRGVVLQPQVPVKAPDGRRAAIDLGVEALRFGVEIDGFLNHMSRFAADRRRARMLALELDWTIAPFAVEEISDNLGAVADEIVRHVRRLERLAA